MSKYLKDIGGKFDLECEHEWDHDGAKTKFYEDSMEKDDDRYFIVWNCRKCKSALILSIVPPLDGKYELDGVELTPIGRT